MSKEQLWGTIKRHADIRGITEKKELWLLEKEFEYEYDRFNSLSPDGFSVNGFLGNDGITLFFSDNVLQIEDVSIDGTLSHFSCFDPRSDAIEYIYGYGDTPECAITGFLVEVESSINTHENIIKDLEELSSNYTPFRQN